jgi:hypothetical protein
LNFAYTISPSSTNQWLIRDTGGAMFVQIIQGRIKDADVFTRQMTRWPSELKPGTVGYVGSTWGLTPDGNAVIAARFESEATMRANDDRPEQDAWWKEMETAFESVVFRDGGSNDAGFVQVIQGRVKDRELARSMFRSLEGQLSTDRPDILGGFIAWNGDDGDFTQVMYFNSEDQARTGETSPDDQGIDTQYQEIMAIAPVFFDLKNPVFD